MNQLTNVVQELGRFVTSGVATQSAQPLEGAAQGAPAASSSDALGAYKLDAPQVPLLKLRTTSAAFAGSGPPPDLLVPPPAGLHHPEVKISQHVGCVVARSTMRRIAQSLLPTSKVRRAILQGVVQVAVEVPAVMAQTRAHTGMLPGQQTGI